MTSSTGASQHICGEHDSTLQGVVIDITSEKRYWLVRVLMLVCVATVTVSLAVDSNCVSYKIYIYLVCPPSLSIVDLSLVLHLLPLWTCSPPSRRVNNRFTTSFTMLHTLPLFQSSYSTYKSEFSEWNLQSVSHTGSWDRYLPEFSSSFLNKVRSTSEVVRHCIRCASKTH